MDWFNAEVTVDRQYRDPEDHDLIERLKGFHAAIGADPAGRVTARISLPAENMIGAAARALAVVMQATGAAPVSLELMSEREFWAREGYNPPDEDG